MAYNSELPCDGDGICMVCKNKPEEEDTLICKTCNTPWHVSCLSSPPETLVSTLQWDCPDCSSLITDAPVPTTGLKSVEFGDLVASIRAIEADGSLTEQEKAKKRQDLMSGGVSGGENKDEEENGDVFDLLGGNLNCSFCMQLPDRPVTTPCGHNFCLKCFQKWIGQGKRTCAKCRNAIPSKMASQPRINASLVVAIRMAKMTKSSTKPSAAGPFKDYHFIHNQNRPDKAFTTERAKYAGKANACSGKIFVTVPSDHFGPIPAENDPERNQGVLVGETWEDRMECRQWGAHLPHVAGIAGQSDYGAQSVALSGGYEDDEDHGEWFLYTGSGGRDLSGNKRTNKEQSFDQKFDKYNEALRVSCKKGYPVRVVRSHKEKRSSYAPESGVRYDGIYRIEKCWRKIGIQGFKVCRYLFVRCDNEPAPWTSDEHGDRPRSLPAIKELKKATDITERKEKPSWDYDEVEGYWKWKSPPPMSKKPVYNGDPEERKRARLVRKQDQNLSTREKLLKEFCCLICRNVLTLPLTTPCAHNFCKHCLEGAFAGQTFVKERTCEGRRTLRTQKNIMNCPACPMEISDFLENPQINRELMDVIASLQRKTEEIGEEAGLNVEEPSKEESDSIEEKPEAGDGEIEVCAKISDLLEDGNKAKPQSPTKSIASQTNMDHEQNEKRPIKNCDALSKDKSDSAIPLETPECGKEDIRTPKAGSRLKRKKADTEMPESSKEDVQTPKTSSRLRQQKAEIEVPESGKEDVQTPKASSRLRQKKAEIEVSAKRKEDVQTPKSSRLRQKKAESEVPKRRTEEVPKTSSRLRRQKAEIEAAERLKEEVQTLKTGSRLKRKIVDPEMRQSGKEDVQTPRTSSRLKRSKVDIEMAEISKDGVQTPKTSSRQRGKKAEIGMPESGKEDTQTPKTSSRLKRKKAEMESCGSTPSGVRTRSMKGKELVDAESNKSKGKPKQSYK